MTTALLAQVTLNQEVTPHRCAHKTKNNVFSRSRAPARQSARSPAVRGGGTGSCLRRRGLGRFMGVSGGIKNNCEVPKTERL